jgi:hypothetical protein
MTFVYTGANYSKGQARNTTRKDLSKVYKKGSINKSGGTKGRKGFKKAWVILDGKMLITAPSEHELTPTLLESFPLREISTIIIEDQPPHTFTITLRDGVKWSLTADDRAEMARWLFGIDGLKNKGFHSSMDTHLKKTMLQQVFKDGFKGGIVKSSFDEEWAYVADGTLQCTEGWTGPEFMWDGSELVPKSGLGKKDPIGWGRFNGFIFEWLDADSHVVHRYWTEEAEREYHCEDPMLTWKWTRHFLALKHGTGEWIVENFVPEPVVFFLSLIRYRRIAMRGASV